jgi:uncharacterized membrane protein
MSTDTIRERIYSIDMLRGVVMMIMLIDHTRDFVHAGAMQFDPTDLSKTNVAVFFTRWITHFCAPIFVFLAGTSIFLQKLYGKSNAELARFLLTRGLWLVLLEVTVVRFGVFFNFDYANAFGMVQVIWAIGVSMIVMAALIYLPTKIVGAIGVAMIVLHNLLDRFQVPPETAFMGSPPPDLSQALWLILHQQGVVPIPGTSGVFVAYPLIPWIGVMAAGYAFGTLYSNERETRRKWLIGLGIAASLLFVVVRLTNVYGDPALWTAQDTPAFTFLSFLNTTKYPPSLLYLMMTLGPALIVLALTDKIDGKAIWQRICITFGRVPMFFYILQWFWAHLAGVVLTLLAGKDITYLFGNPAAPGQPPPADSGFPLWVVYAAWFVGLLILYPLCAWWGRVKQRNKHWALSYI